MSRKLSLIMAFLAMLIGMIWTAKPVSAATNIKIDGDVSDWDNVNKVDTSSKAQVAMVIQGDSLYYYIATNPSGMNPSNDNGWSVKDDFTLAAHNLQIGNRNYSITPAKMNDTDYKAPTKIGDKTKVDINVYSGDTDEYNNNGNAFGYVTKVKNSSNKGYQEVFEGQIALSDFQLKDDDTKLVFTAGDSKYDVGTFTVNVTRKVVDPVIPGDDDSKGDGGSSYKGHANIKIDGSFDDWTDITKTLIREKVDNYNVKKGALLQYDGNIYIYIEMSPHMGSGYNVLMPDGYELTIGNDKYDLVVLNADSTKYTSLKSNGETKPITMGIWYAAGGKNNNNPAGADGYATRYVTQTGGFTDIFEMKIPLKDFEASSTDGQTITLVNHNLGDQEMTATGGSTGPIVLASIGFGIALFGLWQYDRRKKHDGVTK